MSIVYVYAVIRPAYWVTSRSLNPLSEPSDPSDEQSLLKTLKLEGNGVGVVNAEPLIPLSSLVADERIR